jgi:hypothetical protein
VDGALAVLPTLMVVVPTPTVTLFPEPARVTVSLPSPSLIVEFALGPVTTSLPFPVDVIRSANPVALMTVVRFASRR